MSVILLHFILSSIGLSWVILLDVILLCFPVSVALMSVILLHFILSSIGLSCVILLDVILLCVALMSVILPNAVLQYVAGVILPQQMTAAFLSSETIKDLNKVPSSPR